METIVIFSSRYLRDSHRRSLYRLPKNAELFGRWKTHSHDNYTHIAICRCNACDAIYGKVESRKYAMPLRTEQKVEIEKKWSNKHNCHHEKNLISVALRTHLNEQREKMWRGQCDAHAEHYANLRQQPTTRFCFCSIRRTKELNHYPHKKTNKHVLEIRAVQITASASAITWNGINLPSFWNNFVCHRGAMERICPWANEWRAIARQHWINQSDWTNERRVYSRKLNWY